MIDIQNYGEMECPVCGKFYFSKLDETDIELIEYVQCRECGWINDVKQTENPDEKNGNNKESLNEYKAKYRQLLKKNPDYCYSESVYKRIPHLCPVCGKYEFADAGSFMICPYCGWMDDELMEAEPLDWAGCSNDLCLNDFKIRYQKLVKDNPSYSYKKNGL